MRNRLMTTTPHSCRTLEFNEGRSDDPICPQELRLPPFPLNVWNDWQIGGRSIKWSSVRGGQDPSRERRLGQSKREKEMDREDEDPPWPIFTKTSSSRQRVWESESHSKWTTLSCYPQFQTLPIQVELHVWYDPLERVLCPSQPSLESSGTRWGNSTWKWQNRRDQLIGTLTSWLDGI
jgi:hypothetical protein